MSYRKYAWVSVLVLGSLLLLPRLGSYGLWDPVEIQQADVAQDVARSGSFGDVTVDGRYDQRPLLYVWAVALGFKIFGVNELAGRLPLALLGVLTLLAVYRVGRRLFSLEAGLAAALVLGTTPVFLFQGRQLASQMPLYFGIIAGAGGLAAYLWPVTGRRCRWDLVLGAVGLVAGGLGHGLALGVGLPLLALALAVILSWRTSRPLEVESDEAASSTPPVPPRTSVGQDLRGALKPLLGALAAAGAVLGVVLATSPTGKFMVMGATWQKLMLPPTFETTFKELGWGFFPWIGLLPLALALFIAAQRRTPDQRAPQAMGKMLVVVITAGAYVLSAIWMAYFGRLLYPALPWAALAVGVLLAETYTSGKLVHRLWALVAVCLVLAVHQDYFMKPESLAFSHLLSHAKYPIDLKIKTDVRVFGFLFAVAFFFALGGTPRPINRNFRATIWGKLAGLLAPAVDGAGAALRAVLGQRGERAFWGVGVLALVFAGWCVFYLTPQLSLHMSNKALFSTFHKCRSGNEMLAQYQVPGRGAAYYNNGQVEEVRDQNHLFSLLRDQRRWFILIPSHQLAPLDRAARQQKVPYYVLDDRSSQYLMLSNQLTGRCDTDHNPLRRYVRSEAPKPKHQVTANFENKVQLLGYDVDDVVTRGGKFRFTLYFKVLGQMPAGYKIFLHFDQPANRFHGDHVPLDGKYPTEYWLPGDYIVDPYDIEIPIITTPSGSYQIYFGFWLGSQRLKVTEGPNDGVNRVPLGTLRVR